MISKMTATTIFFFLSVTNGLGRQGSVERSSFSSFNGFMFHVVFLLKILNIASAPNPSSIPVKEIANFPFANNVLKS